MQAAFLRKRNTAQKSVIRFLVKIMVFHRCLCKDRWIVEQYGETAVVPWKRLAEKDKDAD